jgi:hypothetical protein
MRKTNYQQIREVVLFEDAGILDSYEDSDVLFENFIADLYGPAGSEVLRSIHNTNEY